MASGRTTRQVDEYVQRLFNESIGVWIRVLDHSGCEIGNEGLFFKIRKRMELEHGITLDVKRGEKGIFEIRIPERVMIDMANRRTIAIEDAERIYKEVKEQPRTY